MEKGNPKSIELLVRSNGNANVVDDSNHIDKVFNVAIESDTRNTSFVMRRGGFRGICM